MKQGQHIIYNGIDCIIISATDSQGFTTIMSREKGQQRIRLNENVAELTLRDKLGEEGYEKHIKDMQRMGYIA